MCSPLLKWTTHSTSSEPFQEHFYTCAFQRWRYCRRTGYPLLCN